MVQLAGFPGVFIPNWAGVYAQGPAARALHWPHAHACMHWVRAHALTALAARACLHALAKSPLYLPSGQVGHSSAQCSPERVEGWEAARGTHETYGWESAQPRARVQDATQPCHPAPRMAHG